MFTAYWKVDSFKVWNGGWKKGSWGMRLLGEVGGDNKFSWAI